MHPEPHAEQRSESTGLYTIKLSGLSFFEPLPAWFHTVTTYLPVFAFVVGVASLGLFVFMVAPPRLVGGSDLAEPLLDGEAAATPVV